MPKVSVIVPVYNVERYLNQCVESLLRQTFPDFELLLVNDASTDGSLALCRRYESDPRVRVIDKPHGGLGDTRNRGVREARGEYLAFVDSDDWVEPRMLEDLTAAADREEADLVLFDYIRENEEDGVSRVCSLPAAPGAPQEKTAARVLQELTGPAPDSGPWREVEMLGCAWRRLYRRTWFCACGLSYYKEQEVMLEDLPVSIQAHVLARRTVYVPGAYYHYRYNPVSLSTRYRPGKMEMLLRCHAIIGAFLDGQGLAEAYADRRSAWLVRQAAHGSLVNCFSPQNPAGFGARWREVRGILRQPAVHESCASPNLKHGTKADRVIRLVIGSRCTAAAYVFYSLYARSLRRSAGKK